MSGKTPKAVSHGWFTRRAAPVAKGRPGPSRAADFQKPTPLGEPVAQEEVMLEDSPKAKWKYLHKTGGCIEYLILAEERERGRHRG